MEKLGKVWGEWETPLPVVYGPGYIAGIVREAAVWVAAGGGQATPNKCSGAVWCWELKLLEDALISPGLMLPFLTEWGSEWQGV